jgi:hypothetical protein
VLVTVETERTQAEPSLPAECGITGCSPATSVERLHIDWGSAPCAAQSTTCVLTVNSTTDVNIGLSRLAGLTSFHSTPSGQYNCGFGVNSCVDTNWDLTLTSLLAATSGPLQVKVGRFRDTIPSTNPSIATPSTGSLNTRSDVIDDNDIGNEDYNLTGPPITLAPGQGYNVTATGHQNCHTGFVELAEVSGTGSLRLNFDATNPRDCNIG